MTTRILPIAEAASSRETELQDRIAQLREQERLLRSLLLDARDELVRTRLGVDANRLITPRRRRPAVEAWGPQRPLTAVTIISRNYLAQARTVARTFLRHEPESRFYLLVVDGLPEGVDVGVDVTSIDLEELDIPNLYEMCFKYGVVEFSTAVKPYLLSLLLSKYGEDEVIYFDPDIMIMRRLVELRDALGEGDIVLTPHIMRPLPVDGRRPSEQDIMVSGAYNLGFIALKRSPQSDEFLTWWEQRLEDGCRIDVPRGLFTDQKWIDLVPSLFPGTVILRDPTYNVAFWNLHERSITHAGEDFLVNGTPASFFHLSGFHPGEPRKLSKHQDRVEVAPGSPLATLLDLYAKYLRENGFDEAAVCEYGFERFDNGIRVHPILRQLYLNLNREERGRFGNPFSTGEHESFLDWATRPAAETGGLSPFLRTLYEIRYDLSQAYPDVDGRDRKPFVKWARRWGSAEMRFEPELVRDEEAQATVGGTPPASSSGSAPRQTRPATTAAGSRSSYFSLIERIRNVVRTTLPAGSNVLVVSKGDSRLLDLGGSEGWHFPQTEGGIYGGYHPADSKVAIAHLEALRKKGAGYLLIPKTGLWWLEYYEGFRRHLETHYRPVAHHDDSCVIYALRGARNGDARQGAGTQLWWQWRWWPWRRTRAEAASAPRSAAGGGAR
ncbi:MAG: hypothetical protein ACRD2Z_02765 [Thermoanaerobaculia bacterium]